jgi:hypothetical protein
VTPESSRFQRGLYVHDNHRFVGAQSLLKPTIEMLRKSQSREFIRALDIIMTYASLVQNPLAIQCA